MIEEGGPDDFWEELLCMGWFYWLR
jgi:hypothetical protein